MTSDQRILSHGAKPTSIAVAHSELTMPARASQFKHQSDPTARAMAAAYEQVKAGSEFGRFQCPAPRCGGTVTFSGNPKQPHRTAGSCNSTGCIRWATQ